MKVPQLSAAETKKLKELEKLISSRSDELNKIREKHNAVEEQVHVPPTLGPCYTDLALTTSETL